MAAGVSVSDTAEKVIPTPHDTLLGVVSTHLWFNGSAQMESIWQRRGAAA